MRIKTGLSLVLFAMACLLSGRLLALDAQSVLEQRICENLKTASDQVMDDTSDTTKYLSPYIAEEIYEKVVTQSVLAAGDASADIQTPPMAQLPCGDTVSTFLMSIKKRMEFNRMDYFLARYRFWIIAVLIVGLLGGLFYRRFNRHSMQ